MATLMVPTPLPGKAPEWLGQRACPQDWETEAQWCQDSGQGAAGALERVRSGQAPRLPLPVPMVVRGPVLPEPVSLPAPGLSLCVDEPVRVSVCCLLPKESA